MIIEIARLKKKISVETNQNEVNLPVAHTPFKLVQLNKCGKTCQENVFQKEKEHITRPKKSFLLSDYH